MSKAWNKFWICVWSIFLAVNIGMTVLEPTARYLSLAVSGMSVGWLIINTVELMDKRESK